MGKDIPTKMRAQVRQRDHARCVICAAGMTEIQHRVRRREGGHRLANLVAACRTCHSKGHANPAWARSIGFIVPTWEDPATVPIRTWRGWMLLDDEGFVDFVEQPVDYEPVSV